MDQLNAVSDDQLARELRIRKNRTQIDALAGRYGDAYLVARGIVAFGTTIKGIGLLIGIILVGGGFATANRGGSQDPGSILGIVAIGIGIVTRCPLLCYRDTRFIPGANP